MAKYAIHSTVRGRHNRTLRAQAPAHHRLKQYVGQNQTRLVRSRPLTISEEELLRDLEELKKKSLMGILEVRTLDGRKMDLETLAPLPAAPSSPLPNPPLDSAAKDTPAGQPMPNLPGGKPIQSLPEFTSEEETTEEESGGEEPQIPAEFLSEEPVEEPPTKPVEVESVKEEDRRGRGRRR